MDDALFGRWRRAAGPDDAIVCLGDVAVHGLSGTRLQRVHEAPGWKELVIRNHLRRGPKLPVRRRRPAAADDAHAVAGRWPRAA